MAGYTEQRDCDVNFAWLNKLEFALWLGFFLETTDFNDLILGSKHDIEE